MRNLLLLIFMNRFWNNRIFAVEYYFLKDFKGLIAFSELELVDLGIFEESLKFLPKEGLRRKCFFECDLAEQIVSHIFGDIILLIENDVLLIAELLHHLESGVQLLRELSDLLFFLLDSDLQVLIVKEDSKTQREPDGGILRDIAHIKLVFAPHTCLVDPDESEENGLIPNILIVHDVVAESRS